MALTSSSRKHRNHRIKGTLMHRLNSMTGCLQHYFCKKWCWRWCFTTFPVWGPQSLDLLAATGPACGHALTGNRYSLPLLQTRLQWEERSSPSVFIAGMCRPLRRRSGTAAGASSWRVTSGLRPPCGGLGLSGTSWIIEYLWSHIHIKRAVIERKLHYH